MSKWIDKLEANAMSPVLKKKGNLGTMNIKGDWGNFVSFLVGREKICLDGDFTIDQLQDLVDHMKQYNL